MLALMSCWLHLPPHGVLQATAAAAIGAYAGFLAASVQRDIGADLPPLLLQALGRGAPLTAALPPAVPFPYLRHSPVLHPLLRHVRREGHLDSSWQAVPCNPTVARCVQAAAAHWSW